MKIEHLLEGTEPKLPGAPEGVKIMTPQQFVSKSDDGEETEKEEGVAEATKLPADTRELKGSELEDYLERIRKQEKTKQDKYRMPYIHRSSVVSYYNEDGKKYNTDAIKAAIKERPKKLLKKKIAISRRNGKKKYYSKCWEYRCY